MEIELPNLPGKEPGARNLINKIDRFTERVDDFSGTMIRCRFHGLAEAIKCKARFAGITADEIRTPVFSEWSDDFNVQGRYEGD